ncbi:MAG: hypothetical protein R3B70_07660 [Polyangiaceae bacterium]
MNEREGYEHAAAGHEGTSFVPVIRGERANMGQARPTETGRPRRREDRRGRERLFDEGDLAGWAQGFFGLWRKQNEKHAWVPPPEEPWRTIGDVARVAIFGEYGTGQFGGTACAESMATARPAFDALIHLGDSHCPMLPVEPEERFLGAWPAAPEALSIALCSSQEMASGARGYFEAIRSARFGQPSSAVAIENRYFVIACLDSAYSEGDLAGDQAGWVLRLSERARARGQRLVLMSHHGPMSLFEPHARAMVSALGGVLRERRVLSWYWAHERRAVVFEMHEGWGLFGRCVGNSGNPARRDDVSKALARRVNAGGTTWNLLAKKGVPPGWVLDGENPFVPGHTEECAPPGFASLILDGPHLHEIVHAASGRELWTEQLC